MLGSRVPDGAIATVMDGELGGGFGGALAATTPALAMARAAASVAAMPILGTLGVIRPRIVASQPAAHRVALRYAAR
jgi:hypothetical protein